MIEKRAARAVKTTGDIVIGIVDTKRQPNLYHEGVTMALEELNKEGGVLGRKLRPIFEDDTGNAQVGREIAKNFAKNPDVVAVIGHRWSSVAIPASIIYEASGIVLISPGASDPDLTRSDDKFILRNIPSDMVTGKEIAKFVHSQGYKKVAIIYDRDSYGKYLANIFHKHINDIKDIEIVSKSSYSDWEKDFRFMIASIIKKTEFDAVFLGAGGAVSGSNLIKQMRNMGVNVPIVTSDILDSPRLIHIAGKAAEGVILPTVFNPKHPSPITRAFVRQFKKKYSIVPDTWAAQGYDAVRVLAAAFEKSESVVPMAVSTTLHFMNKWHGVTGGYSFTSNGDITGKDLFFKEFKDGEFQFIKRDSENKISPFEVLEDITLRLPLDSAVATLDPGKAQGKSSIEVIEQLFLGLTDYTPGTLTLAPELAEEWNVSKNGIYYLFRLRQDAVWTNGDPVTAHDVVWAIRRNIKPTQEGKKPQKIKKDGLSVLKNASAIRDNKITDDAAIGVRAIDDFTLWFELEAPYPYFPALTSLPVYYPLPRKTIEEHAKKWTLPENIQTNGSYKLVLHKKGVQVILRKNPQYYNAKDVKIPEVRYYIIPQSAIGLAMYEENLLDIMGGDYLPLPHSKLTSILNNPTLTKEYSLQPSLYTYTCLFNPIPPLDKVLVRKAISAAINRDLIILMVTQSNESAAATLTTPPAFGAAVEIDKKKKIGIIFNPLLAQKQLAEAGYPDGKGFPEITLTYPESERNLKIASAIQTFLRHYLNIKIKLDEKSGSDYQNALANPDDLYIYLAEMRGEYPDANAWFDKFDQLYSAGKISREYLLAKWEFLAAILQAETELNPKKRKLIYRRAEQILCEKECLIMPLFFGKGNYLLKPRVQGWYNTAVGGQHIRDWYLKNNE
ncbi:ABC transporter substrate-binding protein [Desulfococcaceae bacterium HSG9]|nr:ABC transporter substrate-binding protein [Desulfococcaceae bacterium HSG9]